MKILAALSVALLLAACGVDAGARVGSYGVHGAVGTTGTTYDAPAPSSGPSLPPPLPR